MVQDGGVRPVIQEYYRRVMENQAHPTLSLATLETPGRVLKVFQSATVLSENGTGTNVVPMGGAFRLRLELASSSRSISRSSRWASTTTWAIVSCRSRTRSPAPILERLQGRHMVECMVPMLPLAPGDYWLKLGLSVHGDELDEIERALHFTVTEGDAFGDGRGFHRGVCVAPSRWQLAN